MKHAISSTASDLRKHHTSSRRTSQAAKKKDVIERAIVSNSIPSIPDGPSVAALATLYCSEPESEMRHEELLEYARIQLGKYNLEPQQLNDAAPVLAKALHMLLEQNGGRELDAQSRHDIEEKVLEWCGC